MVNQKTTAVRIIPVVGKTVGDTVEFGGLLGYAPVMPVNSFGCGDFVNRIGRIPAPIHSFRINRFSYFDGLNPSFVSVTVVFAVDLP